MPVIVGEAMRGQLQRLSEENMPERALIERPVSTRDAHGGRPVTWVTVASGVKCRVTVANITAREDVITRQTVSQTIWFLWFPLGTDVRETDRVTVNGTVRYNVQNAIDQRTNRAMLQYSAIKVV